MRVYLKLKDVQIYDYSRISLPIIKYMIVILHDLIVINSKVLKNNRWVLIKKYLKHLKLNYTKNTIYKNIWDEINYIQKN